MTRMINQYHIFAAKDIFNMNMDYKTIQYLTGQTL